MQDGIDDDNSAGVVAVGEGNLILPASSDEVLVEAWLYETRSEGMKWSPGRRQKVQ